MHKKNKTLFSKLMRWTKFGLAIIFALVLNVLLIEFDKTLNFGGSFITASLRGAIVFGFLFWVWYIDSIKELSAEQSSGTSLEVEMKY